ncbi:MAG: DUF389 domain-containing protein [Candidatus Promineofilum sp.]|nr:DUF389 domain-containing protein [Promineifilum sp.]
MNELTVTVPKGQARRVAEIALAVGIQEVGVSQIYVHGPDEEKEQLSMDVSVPQTQHFIDRLLTADFYDPRQYSISSDEVLSLISQDPPEKITWPMKLSAATILQDLWVQNQITIAYIARAFISGLILSYGLIEGDLLALFAALLFTPFLSQVLAMGFGFLMQDWRLARKGLQALATSTGLVIVAGIVTASLMGGQIQHDEFGTLISNFAISLIVAIVSGLDTADKSGRREFIAVTAAAQFAAFPAWFGISLVLGFPDSETTMWRILTFFVNIVTILIVSISVYAWLRYRPTTLHKYLTITRGRN